MKTDHFEHNNYNGLKNHNITIFKEVNNIIFTSIHSINHYNGVKESNLKYADLKTGYIVEYLSFYNKCSTIINQYRHFSINPYKGITNTDKYIRLYNNNKILLYINS